MLSHNFNNLDLYSPVILTIFALKTAMINYPRRLVPKHKRYSFNNKKNVTLALRSHLEWLADDFTKAELHNLYYHLLTFNKLSFQKQIQIFNCNALVPTLQNEPERYLELLTNKFPDCDRVKFVLSKTRRGLIVELDLVGDNILSKDQYDFILENLPTDWNDTQVHLFYDILADNKDDEENDF